MVTGAESARRFEDAESREIVLEIAAAGPGAREAEAALCRRYARRILVYGRYQLKSVDSANDLVQIVLLGLIEAARAGRVRDPDHLENFLLAICRNAALRLRAKDARNIATEAADLEKQLIPVPAAEVVDDRALAGCMEGLEERARTVVTMAFGEDHQAEAIAKVLKTTAGNVRVIRHRALATLRRCLDDKRDAS